MKCPNCGAETTVLVWEDLDDYERGGAPDYIGCTTCHVMRPNEEVAVERGTPDDKSCSIK